MLLKASFYTILNTSRVRPIDDDDDDVIIIVSKAWSTPVVVVVLRDRHWTWITDNALLKHKGLTC